MNKQVDPETIENIYSITVSGQWAHFRRADATTPKHSYQVIPRTVAAGLVSAMLGYSRDSYYEYFSVDRTAIGITLNEEIRTQNIAVLELTTSEDEGSFEDIEGDTIEAVYSQEQTLGGRQRRMLEYLTEPSYTLDIATAHDDLSEDLRQFINDPRPVYTPYLGTSECLASIDEAQTHSFEETNNTEFDSVVPANTADALSNDTVATERSAVGFEALDVGRKPMGYWSYAYNRSADPISSDAKGYKVEDRTVYFK